MPLSRLDIWPSLLLEQLVRTLADVVVLLVAGAAALLRLGRLLFFLQRSPPRKRYTSILITGASSGIGAGLAEAFAAHGVRLVLTARRGALLEQVAARCRAKGAACRAVVADVTDERQMREAIEAADAEAPLDLVVANAGVLPDPADGLRAARAVFDTNVYGVLNTVLPAVERMRGRRSGQVALISSLGALAPPTNRTLTPYLASKAAVRVYGDGLRASLAAEGVGVTVVLAGLVESGMSAALRQMAPTEHEGEWLPLVWGTRRACAYMRADIEANAPVCRFPSWLALVTVVLGSLPPDLKELALPAITRGDPFRGIDEAARARNEAPRPRRARSPARR